MSDQVPEGTTAAELKRVDEKTDVKVSALAEALQVLAEKGVIQRNQAADILENHSWLVSVGELPELERGALREHLVPAPDETGSNVAGISARQTPEFVPESPASLGSFGVLNGTLSVDRTTVPDGHPYSLTNPVAAAPEADPLADIEALADEHVSDDEPTAVGTRRSRKKH